MEVKEGVQEGYQFPGAVHPYCVQHPLSNFPIRLFLIDANDGHVLLERGTTSDAR